MNLTVVRWNQPQKQIKWVNLFILPRCTSLFDSHYSSASEQHFVEIITQFTCLGEWTSSYFVTKTHDDVAKTRMGVGVCTGVNAEQPGADERRERLARFGQQGNHPKEESGGSLLTSVHHKVLVDQVRNHQFQQLTGALCEHPVTETKTGHVRNHDRGKTKGDKSGFGPNWSCLWSESSAGRYTGSSGISIVISTPV